MEDKFLVVVIDDVNIVHKQRLLDTYKQAKVIQRDWREKYRHSNKEVEIQLLTDSAPENEYKVITLNENWA
jgi:hypothetical protein